MMFECHNPTMKNKDKSRNPLFLFPALQFCPEQRTPPPVWWTKQWSFESLFPFVCLNWNVAPGITGTTHFPLRFFLLSFWSKQLHSAKVHGFLQSQTSLLPPAQTCAHESFLKPLTKFKYSIGFYHCYFQPDICANSLQSIACDCPPHNWTGVSNPTRTSVHGAGSAKSNLQVKKSRISFVFDGKKHCLTENTMITPAGDLHCSQKRMLCCNEVCPWDEDFIWFDHLLWWVWFQYHTRAAAANNGHNWQIAGWEVSMWHVKIKLSFLFLSAALVVLMVGTDAGCFRDPSCENTYKPLFRKYSGYSCCLTQIPSGIPGAAHTVDLSNNIITSIPAGVLNHLSRCTSLNLNQNNIITIDYGAFKGMTALFILQLSMNKLSSLDRVLFGVNTLDTLNLIGNQLSHLGKGLFSQSPSLSTLKLSKNRLSMILRNILEGISSVRKMYWDNNVISFIEIGAFKGLISLVYLDLSCNNLSSIHPGTFAGLNRTTRSVQSFTLYLHNNRLTSISLEVFKDFPRPLILELSSSANGNHGNQWRCSTLCWLKRAAELTIWYSGIPRCANGTPWAQLDCTDKCELLTFLSKG